MDLQVGDVENDHSANSDTTSIAFVTTNIFEFYVAFY